ncbi:MAG TPA: tetratricopeptide repeat protein [Thermoplasmata archaeon]|nr:tetratricopeptide repeat protein [Thermoplasmata archaeon]
MSSSARGSAPSPAREIRERYRAAESAESASDRAKYVEALKEFLATAERNADQLTGEASEVAPLLDEAAMSFYRASLPDLARRAVDLGLKLSPAHPSLLHHKALVLLALNQDLPTAVKLVDQALAASPHDKGMWATRGDALRLLGQNVEAARAYLKAQRLDASSTQFVDRALQLAPGDPEVLRAKVELARAGGGDLEALQACESLLKEHPDDLELLRSQAALLAAVGRPKDALAPLLRVREARPDDLALALLHAQVLARLGRAGEAMPIATAIVEAKEAPEATVLEQVAELAGADRPELALTARERLRAVDPRNVHNLQELRALAARSHRPDIALDAGRAILLASPENLEAMRAVAELEVEAGHTDEALEAYRQIAKAHPRATHELSKALEFACSASRPDAVREFARAILAVEPTDLRAQLELARALAAAKEVDEASRAYDALIAAHPGDVAYLLEKKELLAAAGKAADLLPILDELFRLDPTRTEISVDRGNLYLQAAYELAEGSADRDRAARAALGSYEHASTDPAAVDVSLLGIARASRLIDDRDRALAAYTEFLGRPENAQREDVRREFAHALRESGRYVEARAEYERAIRAGQEEPELLWGAVEVYAHLGQDAPALRLLDLLLAREPGNPMFLRKKGQVLLRAGRRDEALRVLQEAVGAAKGDPHAYFEVAEALRVQGSYPDAIAYYRRGLEVEPANRHGRLALAETLLLAGQYPEAIGLVDPLLKEDPNDLAAWKARADAWRAIGRPGEILYSLQAILLLEPDDGAALLEVYRLRRDAGETREAFDALTRLVRSNAPEGQDPTLQLERGDLAAGLGLPDEANAAYERAATMDPAYRLEISIRRARLRLAAGRPDLALEVLDDGLKSVPGGGAPSVGALLLRAEVLSALERPAEARTAYEEVRRREPRSPVALAGIGQSMIAEGKHAEAAEFLRTAIPQLPPQEALFLELAEAESGVGHLDVAAEAMRQAVDVLPKSVALWTRLAEIAIARKAWSDAANAFAHALALAPASVDLLMRAGFVAGQLGHPNEALALYLRATEADPTNKQTWTSHGLALIAAGRAAEAQGSFDRALSLDSDFGPAKDGKKLAVQQTRDGEVQRFGREALLLEAKLHRPVTKNDLFVTLHVPFEFLDPVLGAISQSPKIDLARLDAAEVRDLENASYQLVTAALDRRPPGIERRGFTLADVAALAPPSYSLVQTQRLFGYLRAVLEADLRPENLSLAPDVEELARRALSMPPEQRTLFQIVRTLRVGVYKARLIKVVEEAGSAVHAPLPSLDLGAFSPEFRTPPPDGPVPPAAPAASATAVPHPAKTAPADREPASPRSGHDAPAHATGHGHAPPPAAGARCVGCGGVASVVHVCGAALCHTCVGQFPSCPKCGQPVPPESHRPIHPPSGEPHHGKPAATSAPAPAGHKPRPTPGPAVKGAANEPTARAEAKTDAKAETRADRPPRPTPEKTRSAAPPSPGKPGASPPPAAKGDDDEDDGAEEEAAAPAPPRPRREKVDDEPRL